MTVTELIRRLEEMPDGDADIAALIEGSPNVVRVEADSHEPPLVWIYLDGLLRERTATMKTTKELRIELREAEERERAERTERLAAVPIKWRYTLIPYEPRPTWDELYDDSCCFYELHGEVMNRDEAKLVGHPDFVMTDAGMRYVYNGMTGKFICSTSGGTIYVSGDGADETFSELSEFIHDNPDGGDVTAIVEAHRAAREGS